MGFRERFKNKKGSLGKQHVKQTQNKDQKGRFPTIIRKDLLPAGVETWQCKEGDHLLDILPFPAGPDFPIDPDTGSPMINEGELAYILDIQVHSNVGSMKVPYVCPYENFGLPCPICEFIKDNDLELEDWKSVKPKRRVFYLIWLHDTRETEKKGIMLWEISHFSMEEKLAAIATKPKGGGAINFADDEEGMTIAFSRKGSGIKNTQYLGHRFIPREVRIPDKLLDLTFAIDQVVKMHPSYEEIEEAFKGQKGKFGNKGEMEESGSNFSEKDSDDTPDWMKEDSSESPPVKEEKKEAPKPKRKLLRRK